ncbi:MAG: phytoene desaturase family protein [Rhodomicrobiaceae bacterium]
MLKTFTDQNAATQSARAPHAVVIGGGLGGMAAALRLRAKGYRVTLFERLGMLGGRAQVLSRDGFRYDAGPTVITAHFLFEELFELFGRRMGDYLTLVPLAPWYRFRFPDGDSFDYGGTIEDTLAEIRRIEPADCDGYLRLLAHSERLFNKGFIGLADQPFHNLGTMLAQAPALVRLGAYRSVWQMISKFLKSPKLRQAFSIQPLLVGGSPFDTTSIYGLIHYLERKWAVYFAMGGTGGLMAGIAKLIEEVGIQIRLGETVSRVTLSGRRATGVTLESGASVPADIVISNADPMHLFTQMLPREKLTPAAKLKLRTARLSMGLFLVYFGTRRQYPDVAHHTIWLGERFRDLLDDIFKHGRLAEDFSLYIHRPTATDPSFAPAGCDSFYALCPVPNLNAAIDWREEAPRLRNRIVEALDSTILPGLRETITAELILTPADFKEQYLSYQGSGFSIAPYFTQSAWFRFHNCAEGIEGLYLTGAGTHPGAGMPGVLCSAKVIDHLIPAAEVA